MGEEEKERKSRRETRISFSFSLILLGHIFEVFTLVFLSSSILNLDELSHPTR